jgi:hypothetical protein
MEKPLSNDELRELHRITQEAALKAYPNPARAGCPGEAVLGEVAATPWPADHEAYQHIKECSPCLREMLERRTEREGEQRRNRSYRLGAVAAGLVILCGIGGQAWRMHISPSAPAAIINFAIASETRGPDEQHEPALALQSYTRERLTLTVNLPRGSDEGRYGFQVLRPDDRNPLLDVVGEAKIHSGLTTFTANVDLSRVPPGTYMARVRNLPAGGWHNLPVQIK